MKNTDSIIHKIYTRAYRLDQSGDIDLSLPNNRLLLIATKVLDNRSASNISFNINRLYDELVYFNLYSKKGELCPLNFFLPLILANRSHDTYAQSLLPIIKNLMSYYNTPDMIYDYLIQVYLYDYLIRAYIRSQIGLSRVDLGSIILTMKENLLSYNPIKGSRQDIVKFQLKKIAYIKKIHGLIDILLTNLDTNIKSNLGMNTEINLGMNTETNLSMNTEINLGTNAENLEASRKLDIADNILNKLIYLDKYRGQLGREKCHRHIICDAGITGAAKDGVRQSQADQGQPSQVQLNQVQEPRDGLTRVLACMFGIEVSYQQVGAGVEFVDSIANYLLDIRNRKRISQAYATKSSPKHFLNEPVAYEGQDPILNRYRILEKKKVEGAYKVSLETKSGIYDMIYKIKP